MDSKVPLIEEEIIPTYIHRSDEKSINSRKRDSRRWLRFSNAVIVGATICLILQILTNLCNPCHQSISQSEAEKVMLNSPSPSYIRNQSQLYTSGPHLAGKNITQATYTRDLWQSYGIETEIEEYEVLLNYPISHRLALLDDDEIKFEAELREDAIPEDPTSQDPDAVPTFHGYSANGNVTGELVYANFGHINDFRLLEKHGVNVSGKVVIVRYGDTFRGLKVKAAQGIHLH
jgi:N-acetylated-alpha-linked acidic dipeptidase